MDMVYVQAFWELEPYGAPWQQTGEIVAAILNAAGGKKGGGKFTADDIINANIPGRAEDMAQHQIEQQLINRLGPPRKAK
jgi:hypothetical protein